MKNLFTKLVALWGLIIAPIKAFFYKKKELSEEEKLELEKQKSIQQLKERFQSDFNVDLKTSLAIMGPSKQTDPEYQKSKIVEARRYMFDNGISPGGGQITDINSLNEHNQMGGYTDKSLKEVIAKDSELAKKSIEGKLDKELKLKAKMRWLSRD